MLALTLLVGACSKDAAIAPSKAEPLPDDEVATSLRKAIAFADRHQAAADAYLQPILDYLHRAFGLEEFSGAAERGRAAVGPSAATDPEYRLFDPSFRVDPAVLEQGAPGALLLPYALACDEPGLPTDAEELFRSQTEEGEYGLTHVGLAIQILDDLGCEVPWAADLRTRVIADLRSAVEGASKVDDLHVERLAVLGYLGEIDAITPSQVAAVVATQRSDGGWPDPDLPTRMHTTALAIWVLELALNGPSEEPLVPLVPRGG